MFFKHIFKNAKKSRKENGLYFGSLIVAIVSFYVLLSLEDQDVISFLRTMESDAIQKLMILIKLVYVLSLFFLFFLIYFSSRYHLERRKKEFGMYQMLGMRRGKIFGLLMGETIYNSLISLLIGIPIALFLTELISLATIKIIGIGIIGHQFKFSYTGIIGTVIGFLLVQIIAMILLSISISKKEPLDLIKKDSSKKQIISSEKSRWIYLIIGVILLIIAYLVAILLLKSLNLVVAIIVLVTGITGTFMFFKGISALIGNTLNKRSEKSSGLFTFTMRQIQENIFFESNTLAFSSLLVLLSMICIAFGASVAISNQDNTNRTVDFSITASEEEIKETINTLDLNSYVENYYPVYLDSMRASLNSGDNEVLEFSWEGFRQKIEKMPESKSKKIILQYLTTDNYPYIISLESFNKMREASGKENLILENNEVAFYSNSGFYSEDFINEVLKENPYIIIQGEKYDLAKEYYIDNIVADRAITLSNALIVSDDLYKNLIGNTDYPIWNLNINNNLVEEKGLMQAISEVNEILSESGLQYESYLQGMGRNLFYIVTGSYLTLYLGIIFLIIGNTMIGIKFLIQLSSTKERYEILLKLGAEKSEVFKSAKSQVRIFFGLVIGASLISSIFGIWAMFNSFLNEESKKLLVYIGPIASVIIIMLVIVELIYIKIIDRTSYKEINSLNVFDRG
ncbi:ABC transporter permease [Clostridium sartagoforme]|uniref:ABC transporter permease n=1 Tax=Clostridium sartagoforme TaxID=84031 RepID=A0A4S2DM34_9CLOT|nr:ABC transporter permease [Clostridium sartagoforme]TGY42074.1 ABC transporter permease [Clostridium sartagoforme]